MSEFLAKYDFNFREYLSFILSNIPPPHPACKHFNCYLKGPWKTVVPCRLKVQTMTTQDVW